MRAGPLHRSLRLLTLGLLVFWLVLPLVPLAIWSFAHGWRYPDLVPRDWALSAWSYALSPVSGVPGSLWLTLRIALAVTALSIVIGVPAGRALGLHDFRGKAAVEILVLAPVIVPGIAAALGLHAIFVWLGLTNTIWGVILVHLVPTLPYMILVMAAVFAGFDRNIEAQARTLGAPPLRVLWHVTLPAVLPGLLVGALFAFLVSWGQYALTLVIGGGRVVTLPMLLFNFATSGRNDITGAIAMIYILPGLVILLLTARRMSGRPGVPAGPWRP